jgi:putative transposase
MARQARFAVPGHSHHVLIRGNNRQPVFLDDEDRRGFLGHLANILREHSLALHAYVLMPNHVHLLLTPPTAEAIGQGVQSLGRRYVAGFNARHRRSGTLWEGRYRAHAIGSDDAVLRCMRFLESNPQRNGLALDLLEPAWSSLPHHLGAARDPLVTEPRAYWALGNTPFDREAAYRAWLEQGVTEADVRQLMQALISGRPLGSAVFLAHIEHLTGRSTAAPKRGRPAKVAPTKPNDQHVPD